MKASCLYSSSPQVESRDTPIVSIVRDLDLVPVSLVCPRRGCYRRNVWGKYSLGQIRIQYLQP